MHVRSIYGIYMHAINKTNRHVISLNIRGVNT